MRSRHLFPGIVFLLFLSSIGSPQAGAIDVSGIFGSRGAADDFVVENRHVRGSWKDEAGWDDYLCPNSYYRYDTELDATLSTIDFELNGDGSVDVYADLYDIWADVQGSYRSYKSLCVPLSSSARVGIDRAEIFSRLTFSGSGESLSDINVKVISTRLGAVRVDERIPPWMVWFTGRMANRGLQQLWASRLGDWASGRITELIRKNIPEDKRMVVPVR